MARTTLMIEDSLLHEIKKRAIEEDRTQQEAVNDLLRRGLASRPGRKFVLRLKGWKAKERPGVDITDRDKLFDLMEGN